MLLIRIIMCKFAVPLCRNISKINRKEYKNAIKIT